MLLTYYDIVYIVLCLCWFDRWVSPKLFDVQGKLRKMESCAGDDKVYGMNEPDGFDDALSLALESVTGVAVEEPKAPQHLPGNDNASLSSGWSNMLLNLGNNDCAVEEVEMNVSSQHKAKPLDLLCSKLRDVAIANEVIDLDAPFDENDLARKCHLKNYEHEITVRGSAVGESSLRKSIVKSTRAMATINAIKEEFTVKAQESPTFATEQENSATACLKFAQDLAKTKAMPRPSSARAVMNKARPIRAYLLRVDILTITSYYTLHTTLSYQVNRGTSYNS